MQAKERKITLNRQGQSALNNIERACLDCARYGLEVGKTVQLRIKGDCFYKGTQYRRYRVASIVPRPGYMSGKQSDVTFEREKKGGL